VLTIVSLSLTMAVSTSLSYSTNAFTQIQNTLNIGNFPAVQAANGLNTQLRGFILFLPDLAALGIICLMAQCFILSWFIQSHPLAAVGGIFLLVIFTLISFYISNFSIQIASLSVFASIIGSAGLLLEILINLPVIMLVSCCADIAISITSSRR
jgi:hypothetical protein